MLRFATAVLALTLLAACESPSVKNGPTPKTDAAPSATPQAITPAAAAGTPLPSGLVQARVVRVVDGDTIEVDVALGARSTLRYIGMDTPETVAPGEPVGCFGKEASARNQALVLDKTVYLEKDVSETDRFGRLLRYVYLEDGRMVNELLVQEGFAQVATFPPDVKYQQRFLDAQRVARDAGRGLWSACQLVAATATRPAPTNTSVPPPPAAATARTAPAPPALVPATATTAPPPPPTATRPPAPQYRPGDAYNCGDFATYAQAKAYFDAVPGDPSRLDADHDGIPCESLPGAP